LQVKHTYATEPTIVSLKQNQKSIASRRNVPWSVFNSFSVSKNLSGEIRPEGLQFDARELLIFKLDNPERIVPTGDACIWIFERMAPKGAQLARRRYFIEAVSSVVGDHHPSIEQSQSVGLVKPAKSRVLQTVRADASAPPRVPPGFAGDRNGKFAAILDLYVRQCV